MVKDIVMKNIDDVKKINEFATRFMCDVWVHGKSQMADAKSIMGLMTLIGHNDLKIVFPDHVDSKMVIKQMSRANI